MSLLEDIVKKYIKINGDLITIQTLHDEYTGKAERVGNTEYSKSVFSIPDEKILLVEMTIVRHLNDDGTFLKASPPTFKLVRKIVTVTFEEVKFED